MEYWIESKKDEMKIGRILKEWQEGGYITIKEKGDLLANTKKRLRKIHNALSVLKNAGISLEVMESYIYANTTGVSKSDLRLVLEKQEEFFKKLGLEEVE